MRPPRALLRGARTTPVPKASGKTSWPGRNLRLSGFGVLSVWMNIVRSGPEGRRQCAPAAWVRSRRERRTRQAGWPGNAHPGDAPATKTDEIRSTRDNRRADAADSSCAAKAGEKTRTKHPDLGFEQCWAKDVLRRCDGGTRSPFAALIPRSQTRSARSSPRLGHRRPSLATPGRTCRSW